MKTNGSRTHRRQPPTLADLVATVTRLTHDDRLSAMIVADMVNSRRVRLEGIFHGKQVVIR